MKKHVSQMSQAEVDVLKALVLGGEYGFTDYARDRMRLRKISAGAVLDAIFDGELVEYHLTEKGESRVLMRGFRTFKGRVVCAVVDLIDEVVVTVYTNHFLDNHSTLDESAYVASLDILDNVKKSLNSWFDDTD